MVAATEQQEATSSASPEPSIRHLTDQLRALVAELGAYAKYLLTLQVDRLKLRATRIAIYAVLAIAGLAVTGGVLVFSTGLLLLGLSGLIGSFLGSFWLGATIVGFLPLGMWLVALVIAVPVIGRRKHAALRAKYAAIRHKQKAAFGRDIREVSDAR